MQLTNIFVFAVLLISAAFCDETPTTGSAIEIPADIPDETTAPEAVVPTEVVVVETTEAEVTDAPTAEETTVVAEETTAAPETAAPEVTEAAPQAEEVPAVPTETPQETPVEETPVEEKPAETNEESAAAPETTARPVFSTEEPIDMSTDLEGLFNSTANATSVSFRSAGSFFVAPIVLFALTQ
ncbi:hypothetical protein B9Z55_002420 [Caenorhabditis nigoni]|uniref:Uncharacterized protein n=1 Tax=Caenorhabditis nigoni TaxID=1611254 RepID=A0A2G5VKF9_9PELO|nr:hypothetical protein B9Z55_002420 [Caenorhabditis nigoni]